MLISLIVYNLPHVHVYYTTEKYISIITVYYEKTHLHEC